MSPAPRYNDYHNSQVPVVMGPARGPYDYMNRDAMGPYDPWFQPPTSQGSEETLPEPPVGPDIDGDYGDVREAFI